jgi:hypothetical protein
VAAYEEKALIILVEFIDLVTEHETKAAKVCFPNYQYSNRPPTWPKFDLLRQSGSQGFFLKKKRIINIKQPSSFLKAKIKPLAPSLITSISQNSFKSL